MKVVRSFNLLFFLFFFKPLISLGATPVLDATGYALSLDTAPKRVVTLIPSLGEISAMILGESLAKQRMVGVSDYTDYPSFLKKVDTVGSYFRFSIEKVVSLKPDLVLATKDGNPKDRVLHLRSLGIPVFVVDTGNLEQVIESFKSIGALLGFRDRGTLASEKLRRGLDALREQSAKKKRKVLLQVGSQPLVIAGGSSLLNELVEIAGGVNVFSDLKKRYPKVSKEAIFERNPEMILIFSMGQEKKFYEEMKLDWMKYSSLHSVKKRTVFVVEGDSLLRPSDRLLDGVRRLQKVISDAKI